MNYTHILQMKELKICLKTILFNQIQFFLVEASGTFLSGLAILRVFTFSLCCKTQEIACLLPACFPL